MSVVDASVDIRVELPAYSLSFTVKVDPSATIRDVKHEIAKSCPGEPRPDGQRLVYKGRFLNDEQRVEDIWKSSDDARIVHLAVNPSAWVTTPSTTPASTAPSSSSASSSSQGFMPAYPFPNQSSYRPRIPWSPSEVSPLRYVHEKHQIALNALINGTLDSLPPPAPGNDMHRVMAMEIVRMQGWSWPSIIDQDYPPPGTAGQGVKYERVVVDGLPFLSLTTPNATPTPIQVHALKVLSFTFPIISAPLPMVPFPPPPAYNVSYNVNAPTDLNARLQQLGITPIRVTPGQNPNLNPNDPNNIPGAPQAVEIRAVPLRALMLPLMMLVFRTLLIMYFFSPSKRPLFALVLSAWILYEAWGALRVVFGDGRPRDRQRANGGNNQPMNGQPGPGGRGQARQGRGAGAPNANRSQTQAFLAGLSNLNLRAEDLILAGHPARPPSLSHKVRTFVSLLLLSLYPAVWDHRRAALRRREGRLRTEANAIATARQHGERDGTDATEDAQRTEDESRARAVLDLHQKRSLWVQEYVRRAQTTDWADDV